MLKFQCGNDQCVLHEPMCDFVTDDVNQMDEKCMHCGKGQMPKVIILFGSCWNITLEL